MERTLSIIKPDAVSRGLIGPVLQRIEEAGLQIVAVRMVRLSTAQAERFYAVHRERPFYQPLVKFMTSGPVVVSVLEADNAIQRYRDLMGATNPEEAAEGTLRREFGGNVERNAVHGSDSPETAGVEVSFFFSDLEIVERDQA
jgi:nucleoside-diphosphate kinase